MMYSIVDCSLLLLVFYLVNVPWWFSCVFRMVLLVSVIHVVGILPFLISFCWCSGCVISIFASLRSSSIFILWVCCNMFVRAVSSWNCYSTSFLVNSCFPYITASAILVFPFIYIHLLAKWLLFGNSHSSTIYLRNFLFRNQIFPPFFVWSVMA